MLPSGRVIDPETGFDGVASVGVLGGRVAHGGPDTFQVDAERLHEGLPVLDDLFLSLECGGRCDSAPDGGGESGADASRQVLDGFSPRWGSKTLK